jgi:ferritin-like metal-binding protein YciE
MDMKEPRSRARAGRTMTPSRTRSRSSEMSSLRDLFEEELKDLYNAEQQIVKSLPKMAAAVSSPDLKDAFEHHLEETYGHIERLEQIFRRESMVAKRKKCEGMEGLLKEGAELLQTKATPEVKDAGLIGAAQRVEHYEIAGYGTARAFADQLGERDIAKMLQETLNEEGAADKKLTQIAQQINVQAADTLERKSPDDLEREETKDEASE